MSGAYLAERAKRKRDLKKLEMAMLTKLEDTHYARATEFASLLRIANSWSGGALHPGDFPGEDQ